MCTRICLHSLSIKSSYLTILLHTNAHCSEFSGGTATLDGRSSYLIFIELLACKICRCRRPCKHNITIMSLFIPPTFVEIALLYYVCMYRLVHKEPKVSNANFTFETLT